MRPPLTPPDLKTWKVMDGYRIRGRIWNKDRPRSRRGILYLHGIQSHGGWFEWSASILAQSGDLVVVPDRRGSGLNEDKRGDVFGRARWCEDVEWLRRALAGEYGIETLDIVGVSWGGKLAAGIGIQNPPWLRRLLLITPGIFPAVDVGMLERLRIGSALLLGQGDRHFEIPLSDPTLFTDNPAGQKFIADDRLKLTHATARFLWHSSRFDRMLRRVPDNLLRVPTTVWLAGHERIIRNKPTRRWCERVCATPPQIREFTGDHHTLEFAADASAFEAALREWVLAAESTTVAAGS